MEIGATLAINWKLPESVLDGIKNYINPIESNLITTKYLSVASNAIKVNGVGFAGDAIAHLDNLDILTELSIDEQTLDDIVINELSGELEKANAFVKVTNMEIYFWGVRGSIASPGPHTVRFGGNTTCVEIRDGDEFILIDCGTGIRDAGNHILSNFGTQNDINILMTHTHWDHIQGFPFFVPAFIPGNNIQILGPPL